MNNNELELVNRLAQRCKVATTAAVTPAEPLPCDQDRVRDALGDAAGRLRATGTALAERYGTAAGT